jgi:phage terminase large subunit
MSAVLIRLKARPYQQAVIDYFRQGGKHAFEVWHRKAGKDRVATFIESELCFERVGLYWHALPKYEDARKVIWDAITPEGERLIDVSFPDTICRRKNAHEMKIELVNGSIWQPVGADNFNSLVGAFPVHVTYSEYALMHPNARQYIRPAIAMANGTELFITTPRGYNHAHDLFQYAKHSKDWHTSVKTVDDTGVLSAEILAEERATMPDELFRQEYYCDFSAANVGSILGRYVELAEKEGRIADIEYDPEGAPVEISSDIGFRDTAAFWFWQPKHDGFALIDYDEDTGLDAGDWIERLRDRYPYGTIWLPHDAKAKTFQSKRSVLEQFLAAHIAKRVDIVPTLSKADRINAARILMPRCHFNRQKCAEGLSGLREWSFEYNEELKTYSKEPRHDWASHPGDGFSYGAIVMRERVMTKPKPQIIPQGPVTIDQYIRMAERRVRSERI